MKLTFGKTVIADHIDSGVSGLDWSGETQIQTNQFFRGTDPQFIDRGNRAVSVSFTVARIHKSPRIAEQFTLDHPGEVLGVGTLVIEMKDGNGARTIREIANCAIARARGRYTGCTTFTEYSISGTLPVPPKKP